MHLHGRFFNIVAEDGHMLAPLIQKDTVRVSTLRHWASYAHRTNPMSYLPGRAGWVGRARTP
jgi:hypothetical protein